MRAEKLKEVAPVVIMVLVVISFFIALPFLLLRTTQTPQKPGNHLEALRGPRGFNGSDGERGPRGFNGSDSVMGLRGFNGSIGYNGTCRCTYEDLLRNSDRLKRKLRIP